MDATLLLSLRALHVLGVILWVGGTVTAAYALVAARSDGRTAVAAAARRAVLWVATPGLLLAWVAGLVLLLHGWSGLYSKAGWMHGKLTIALVITGLTGYLTGRLRRAAAGQAVAGPGPLRAIALGVLLLAVTVLFLARLQPGGA